MSYSNLNNEKIMNLSQEINTIYRKSKIANIPTELYIHKILYFTYGVYFGIVKIPLFLPKGEAEYIFEAWQYGPVDVEYRINKTEDKFTSPLNFDEQKILNFILNDLIINNTMYDLVLKSYKTSPYNDNWVDNSDNDDKGNYIPWKPIPNKEIMDFFKLNWSKYLSNPDGLVISDYLEEKYEKV